MANKTMRDINLILLWFAQTNALAKQRFHQRACFSMAPGYSIGLKFKLAPSLMPDGQREVMVLVRV